MRACERPNPQSATSTNGFIGIVSCRSGGRGRTHECAGRLTKEYTTSLWTMRSGRGKSGLSGYGLAVICGSSHATRKGVLFELRFISRRRRFCQFSVTRAFFHRPGAWGTRLIGGGIPSSSFPRSRVGTLRFHDLRVLGRGGWARLFPPRNLRSPARCRRGCSRRAVRDRPPAPLPPLPS